MIVRKQVVGYYTEDGNIYCAECIYQDIGLMGAHCLAKMVEMASLKGKII